MGQRLNIEIVRNGVTLANAYYHWRGVTATSLQMVKGLLEKRGQIEEKDKLLYAVRLLETSGALLTQDEVEDIKKKYPTEYFKEAISHNDGLISVTEEAKENTRHHEEGRVQIHLDRETVNFDVLWRFSKKEYMDEWGLTEEEYNALPLRQWAFDFACIPFGNFQEVADSIIQLVDDDVAKVREKDGSILVFME